MEHSVRLEQFLSGHRVASAPLLRRLLWDSLRGFSPYVCSHTDDPWSFLLMVLRHPPAPDTERMLFALKRLENVSKYQPKITRHRFGAIDEGGIKQCCGPYW